VGFYPTSFHFSIQRGLSLRKTHSLQELVITLITIIGDNSDPHLRLITRIGDNNKISTEIKPSKSSAKITYASTFDPNFYLLLRERRATTLAHMQDASVEVESNILVVDRLKNKADRDILWKKLEASPSNFFPLPLHPNEVTKLLKSFSARM
jgi:hypothetical protein